MSSDVFVQTKAAVSTDNARVKSDPSSRNDLDDDFVDVTAFLTALDVVLVGARRRRLSEFVLNK